MWSHSFEVMTGEQGAVVEITERVSAAVAGLGDGLLHILLPHATAGLALIETGSGSERDLLDRLDAVLPRGLHYDHAHGSPGHGRDHLLPALISPVMVLAVREGPEVLSSSGSPDHGPPLLPLALSGLACALAHAELNPDHQQA